MENGNYDWGIGRSDFVAYFSAIFFFSFRILGSVFSFVESIVRRLEWSNKCVGLSTLEVLFVFVVC